MTTPEFLRSIGACEPAIVQVGTRKLKDAVQQSVRADWLFWLAAVNAGKDEWPTRAEVVEALSECVVFYFHVPTEEEFKRLAGPIVKSMFIDFDPVSSLIFRLQPNEFVATIGQAVKELATVGNQVYNAERLKQMADILRDELSFPFLERLDL